MTDQCDALHAAWLPHRAVKLLRSLPPPNPPVETMRCFALLLAVAAAVVHSHAISTRLSPVRPPHAAPSALAVERTFPSCTALGPGLLDRE